MSALKDLDTEVSNAIRKVETAELELSLLEERIAKITSPTSVPGMIARRGAVRAALAGRAEARAQMLVARFLTEDGIEASFALQLKEILLS